MQQHTLLNSAYTYTQMLRPGRCSGLQLGDMLGGQVQFLRNVFQYGTELMGEKRGQRLEINQSLVYFNMVT